MSANRIAGWADPTTEDSKEAEPALQAAGQPAEAEPTFARHDNLQLYLDEIGRTPLLTPEEEMALARRIRAGDRVARNQMIVANLRLVVRIAIDYRDFGLPLLDLISEGNLGLVKAVDRYDPDRGAKLSTYAVWWIKQSIKRALANQARTIRLPVHLVSEIAKLRRTGVQLAVRLGRDPADQELADELQIALSRVARLKAANVQPSSLDAPLGADHGAGTFGETLGDDSAINPYEDLREKDRRLDLNGLLASLDQREAEVIRLRFGFNGQDELTLDQVGLRFELTRERIRQIECAALEKLRKGIARNDQPREPETRQVLPPV
jgi:RNA polymerase primary sigma factor